MIPKLHDSEWLKEQYVDGNRTLESIAQELGCNKGTVGRALRSFGIKSRKRTSKFPQLADYNWLYHSYVIEKKGLRRIAAEVGATPGVVREHLKQKGIDRRNVREGMDVEGRINVRLGAKGANWKGGRKVLKTGYIYIYAPDNPNATKSGYVFEHRLVMEEKIGRHLDSSEIVHHIDGNKSNNHPDNLELKTNGRHISEHFKASHEVTMLRTKVLYLEERLKTQEQYIEILERKLSKYQIISK